MSYMTDIFDEDDALEPAWDACYSCGKVRPLDIYGACNDCELGALDLMHDGMDDVLDDEPSMPSIVDIAFDLEACRDALRDLGEHALAHHVAVALRKVDDVICHRSENNVAPVSAKQKKKKNKKKTMPAPAPVVARVVELKRAMPRRKEA